MSRVLLGVATMLLSLEAFAQDVSGVDSARVQSLLEYLGRATEQATYSCDFSIERVKLSRPTKLALHGKWNFLCQHTGPGSAAAAAPLVSGRATFDAGRFSVCFQCRLYDHPRSVVGLFDGKNLLEIKNQSHAVVWDRVTNFFVPELPWTLFDAGGRGGAASLRTALQKKTCVSKAGIGDDFVIMFPLLRRAEGAAPQRHVQITCRPHSVSGQVLPVAFEEQSGDARALDRRVSIVDYSLVGDVWMPSRFAVEVAIEDDAGAALTAEYSGTVSYINDHIVPSRIMDMLRSTPEVRTSTKTLFPLKGVDAGIDDLVRTLNAEPRPASAEQTQTVIATLTQNGGGDQPGGIVWPIVSKTLQDMALLALSRSQVSSEYCFHAAIAMLARVNGKRILFEDLVRAHPNGVLSPGDSPLRAMTAA